MKRIWVILLAAGLLLCGCKSKEPAPTTAPTTAPTEATVPEQTGAPTEPELENAAYTVGLCLPEKTEKWENVAKLINRQLYTMQCGISVRYAENDPIKQADQIEELMQEGVAGLIITPVDSMELLDVLETAKQANIPVVAYERMLMYTQAVSAYVGLDYRRLGFEMGNHIEQTKMLDVAKIVAEQYTIEFVMGAPEDNSALEIYLGMMDVLGKCVDEGTLVCNSGRVAFEDCCTFNWSTEDAKTRFADILKTHYTEAPPDIICCADDRFTTVCLEAIQEAELDGWPLVAGIGGDALALTRVQEGHQSFTALPGAAVFAEPAAQMIFDLIVGNSLSAGENQRNNYAIDVPAWFGEVEIIVE